MHNKSEPFPTLTFPLMMKRMLVTRRSRTLPSGSFSYDEEHRHECKHKSPPRKGLGKDAIRKALNQISKSFFTRKIEGARLP